MERIREKIIRALSGRKLSYWKLLKEVSSPLVEVVQTLKDLLEKGEVIWDEEEKVLYLKEEGEEVPSFQCPACLGKGRVIKGEFEKAFLKYMEIAQNRPPSIPEYDQGFILPEDLVHKAILMHEKCDLENRKILILGDDDLFSIYVGLVGKCEKITVVEIDERLVNFINEVSSTEKLEIEVFPYDLSNPLPQQLKNSFDVFVSEPPESLEGFICFLTRGKEGLKERGSGYIGLTTLESTYEKWSEIQKWCLNNGFVITDILKNFSRYWERVQDWEKFYSHFRMLKELPFNPGPVDEDWYTSDLLRIERITPRKLQSQDLYMDEETWATPLSFSHGD